MEHHIAVLKEEAVDALSVHPDAIIVDATLGAGGHAHEIIQKLGERGVFVGLDADPAAIEGFQRTDSVHPHVHLAVRNFRHLDSILEELDIDAVDGILADLGWRMEQFRGSGRGFSFTEDESLLMTYGDPVTYPFTARDIVNDWKAEDIANVLKAYGEERYARRIANAITTAREVEEITTAVELAEIITRAVPPQYRRQKIHPATRTFQALRIAVNDELDALKEFLSQAVARLKPKGRLAIITFHSIEDRIVKHTFRDFAHDHLGTVMTKKPIIPTDVELQANPRARSAKLRIFEKYEEA